MRERVVRRDARAHGRAARDVPVGKLRTSCEPPCSRGTSLPSAAGTGGRRRRTRAVCEATARVNERRQSIHKMSVVPFTPSYVARCRTDRRPLAARRSPLTRDPRVFLRPCLFVSHLNPRLVLALSRPVRRDAAFVNKIKL